MERLKSLFTVRTLFFFISTLSFHNISAQIVKDTIVATEYLRKGDSIITSSPIFSTEMHTNSIIYFKKALTIYKRNNSPEKIAHCYNKISKSHLLLYNLEKALENSKKALKTCSLSPNKNRKEISNAYINIGDYYQQKLDYKNSLTEYEKALSIIRNIVPKNNKKIASIYSKLGKAHYMLSNFDKALYYQKKALSLKIQTLPADTHETFYEYNELGVIYSKQGKFRKSLKNYKKALEIALKELKKNDFEVIKILNNIGTAYSYLKDNTNALKYYKIALLNLTKQDEIFILNMIYNNLGIISFKKGDYDSALGFFKKSLDLDLQTYHSDNTLRTTLYSNMGSVFRKKQNYQKALEYNFKSLSILREIYGEKHHRVANTYNNIGLILNDQKEFQKGLIYHKKALDIFIHIFGRQNQDVANSYSYLADIHHQNKQYKQALKYHKIELEILQSIYGKLHFLTSGSYLDIAIILDKQKKSIKSIDFYNKALLSNNKNRDSIAITNSFNPNNYFDKKQLIKTLKEKAETLKSLYSKNTNQSYLNQSITTYKNADILIKDIRHSLKGYNDKIFFADKAKEIYNGAIEAQLLLYKCTQNESALHQAFLYAEKSKANTLKELLNDSNAKNFSSLPNDITSLEKEFRIDRSFYQSQITKERSKAKMDSRKVSSYENALFTISRRQDSLTVVLEKDYPKYYQLKYLNNIISVTDIQRKIDNQTTVLEFFTADSTTYAFTISKKSIQIKELTIPKLAQNIEQLKKTITSKNISLFKRTSHQLYDQLISPIKDHIIGNQLIVIPDGPLWHLNFDVLLTSNNPNIDNDITHPKNYPLLLKDYAISYANSANLLFSKQDTSGIQNNLKNECLAFSFSNDTSIATQPLISFENLRNSDSDLPGTREEIKSISNIVDGKYYYGSEATETNFKNNANQYNILHLALHGQVDNEKPENSKLFFTKSKDSLEDNFLYTHELFAMDIPAELTVLSACNTGSGKIAKGEGIMSLGTAFQYAGTKSLLLTNWAVSDETTPIIMEYFYTNLKKGLSKDVALQQAKLQYLNNDKYEFLAEPFYWGGFYLIGDTAPIQFSTNHNTYWIIGLIVFALLLLSIFWLRKRKASF